MEKNLKDCIGNLTDIFSFVSRHGGKISGFTFEKRNSSDRMQRNHCILSIFDCNCEDIASACYCVVSFQNGRPHFKIELPLYQKSPSFIQELCSYTEKKLCISALKKRLKELGALLPETESDEKDLILSFSVKKGALYSCLKVCALLSEKLFWSQDYLSINEEKESFFVKIVFSRLSGENPSELLFLVCRFAYLFSPELKIAIKISGLFHIESLPYQKNHLLPVPLSTEIINREVL